MLFYYLVLLLLPFSHHPLLSHSFHGFTPIKIVGGLAFLWAILSLNDSPTRVYFQSRSRKYFGLFVAFLCLSMAASGFRVGMDRLFWLVSVLMFYVTTVTLVNSRERFLASCVVLLISMDIASAYMVRQYMQYGPIYENFRPGGIFGDANAHAIGALSVLPIAYFLRKRSTSKLLSLFCLGTMGAILAGLVLSQSRGGMIGLAAVILMIAHESDARLRAMGSLCLVAILIVVFSPVNPLRRFVEKDAGAEASKNVHFELLHVGLSMVRDHPFVGVGFGCFKSSSVAYSDDLGERGLTAHNSYLELAAENGIPALILFLLMCLAVQKDITNAKYLHGQDPLTEGILTGMRIGIIGFLVAGTFFSAEYEKIIWVLSFLGMASSRIEPVEATAENCVEFSEERVSELAEEGVS